MQQNGIGYVLNASSTCPKPDFIPESHFLRVPVNDSFCEKILPWLDKSVDFIGKQHSRSLVTVMCKCGLSLLLLSLEERNLLTFRNVRTLKTIHAVAYLLSGQGDMLVILALKDWPCDLLAVNSVEVN